ncbi:MAG: hypothetical protein ACRBB3_07815 [Alphaproteobacteria bacterium]
MGLVTPPRRPNSIWPSPMMLPLDLWSGSSGIQERLREYAGRSRTVTTPRLPEKSGSRFD